MIISYLIFEKNWRFCFSEESSPRHLVFLFSRGINLTLAQEYLNSNLIETINITPIKILQEIRQFTSFTHSLFLQSSMPTALWCLPSAPRATWPRSEGRSWPTSPTCSTSRPSATRPRSAGPSTTRSSPPSHKGKPMTLGSVWYFFGFWGDWSKAVRSNPSS